MILTLFLFLAAFWSGYFLREIVNKIKPEEKPKVKTVEPDNPDIIPINKQWQNLKSFNGRAKK